MIAQDSVLFGNYTMRVLDDAEFGPLFRQYRPLIFQTMLDFDVQQALSMEEQTATARLRERMGTPFRLNIGIYHQEEFIGWSFGRQESAEKYYMVNTGILPRHQGKGIYSVLLPRILGALQREGFQIVYSRHVATNDQVLSYVVSCTGSAPGVGGNPAGLETRRTVVCLDDRAAPFSRDR